MKRQIEITATPKEVAELLFNLDNEQVAQVFDEWKELFEQEYERKIAAKETVWIFGLNHFMMYVADKMSDDTIDFFRSTYATIVYKMVDNIHKKHLLTLDN
jgi:hypothetical protein